MNIYFTASIAGKKYYQPNYLKIIEILKNKKQRVIADHIVDASESQIKLQTKTQREKFHKQLKKWILDSDCLVVETSFPSISVGFEISLGINLGKPVLVLYTKDPPTLLSSYDDEKLILTKYDQNNLKEALNDFINYVKGKSDLRFTFFIDSHINNFLKEVSHKKRVPKSVYIRNLIQKAMKK